MNVRRPETPRIRRILLLAVSSSVVFFAASAACAMDVLIGQVGPMSGLEANQGRAYGAGMDLLFKEINRLGGVNGHRLTLVRKDDAGRPEDTVRLTKELLADSKPLVLAGYFGNKNVADLIGSGVLQHEKIALIGYRSLNAHGETAYLYNVRAGLQEEINKIADHLVTIGITKLGLFYEVGPNGTIALAATDEAVKRAKGQLLAKASYEEGTTKVRQAVDVFLKVQPQAILIVATGSAAAAFIEQYRGAGGAAQVFTHSGADIEQMAKRLSDEQLQGVAIAQVTPSPYTISSKIGKELTDLVAKTELSVPVSYSMMEGFITAKVIVDVRAESNLSHPADRILSRGWKPTFRWSAVHKCRCLPVSSASLSMS